MPESVRIPERIVVHLGAPDQNAENVTVYFVDYIKNVASSEIFPTWPEEALRANILAQISVALNRIYTEYYRSQGKDFDITSSTAYDQSFVYQRDIFDTVDRVVDELFNSYIRRNGFVEPLFATFCDGVEVNCNGLSQWGSVTLANRGEDALSILKYYFGNDIEIVRDAPVENISGSAPPSPLREGDTGRDVESLQLKLNRISTNYPAIPKIPSPDGFFSRETTATVKEFQRVFGLTDDGIVGRATWYKIQFIYNAVKRLHQVNSEGLKYGELPQNYPGELSLGSRSEGVLVLQYFLEFIALYLPTVQTVTPDGIFGEQTRASVISFQNTYGFTPDGVVDRVLWNQIMSTYYNMLGAQDYRFTEGATLPFGGRIITEGTEGEDVRALQEYLNFIADSYPEIPKTEADGVFGPATERQIAAFRSRFGIPGANDRVGAVLWEEITSLYDDLYYGRIVGQGQFPGYDIGG